MVTQTKQWWVDGFFGLHYDLHANAKDTALGAELTREHLRAELEKVAPDFVQCDCKGHPGYASYPTKVGSPSPGIVRDALRIHRDVTAAMGLPLSVHYSGVWDERAVALHPDWAALDARGKPVVPRPGHPPGIVCPRGPYVDELMIPQLLEILTDYDVDGFWVDGENWAVQDCYCPRCRREFARRTGVAEAPVEREHPDWPAWRAFQRDSFAEYVTRYADAVHARKPTCAVCSNWMYSMRHPGPVAVPVDYLSGDFMPSFGCERAEMEGRYLDGHRMPWNLMAWTFCSPEGMPHQTKTAAHLCQEAAEVMSCGGGVFLYDQPQRCGWLTSWHQDIFAKVARFCRARQPFCQFTEALPETAVLVGDGHIWRHNPEPFVLGEAYYGFEGALHALIENQRPVDVLDETRLLERLARYKLVVAAEQDDISPALLAAFEGFVAAGGILLMSGAHLADLCPGLLGVAAAGEAKAQTWHIPFAGECLTLKEPWRPVRLLAGTEMFAPVMTDQDPGRDATPFPAVTLRRAGRGVAIGIHGRFMESYLRSHHPRIRRFVRALLEAAGFRGRIEVAGPPWLEVSMRRGRDFTAVHLVNRAAAPTLTPRLHMVEQIPPIEGVALELSVPRRPELVTLEPGGRQLSWEHADGRLRISVPEVAVHEIVVIRGPAAP